MRLKTQRTEEMKQIDVGLDLSTQSICVLQSERMALEKSVNENRQLRDSLDEFTKALDAARGELQFLKDKVRRSTAVRKRNLNKT